ncbi:tRNA lysidine(34) synthetase TilS [Metabacillus iocasae]|uniref:tRNA(Ile)-lysidine synthase n=1 Tax=Priestia iocasae TaxID=2291674 RepID=A0ABS2R0D2_9BACI|nr:tRNA lysidine(34) synthetase TilS [Metabacillus iocasae]MBM7704898.1 tRNA(Ile)-lysidine synthase [Metabacillus iocasae]
MKERVNSFIRKHKLIPSHSRIVIGVSGGPDSLALLHFLWSKREEMNLELVVAHVDHMFRGKGSEEDMEYVKQYCQSIGVCFEGKKIHVEAYQKEHQLSAQLAARECRYAFFQEIMEKYNSHLLALAHHGDDQIETILMRLARGSTMEGYVGIKPRRPFATGHIIRPFLSVTKEEILQYCKEFYLQPRIDPSNAKKDYTRNRFRHEVLPFFKMENPVVHEKIQRFSEDLDDDQRYLEELTAKAMNKVMEKQGENQVILQRNGFLTMRKPLQRRGIQLILRYLYKKIPQNLSSTHIDSLVLLLESEQPSGTLHFPNGLKVIRSYNDCLFTFEEEKVKPYRYVLNVPGYVHLPNNKKIICEIHNVRPYIKGNDVFVLGFSQLGDSLIVRTRHQGDKMTIKGMNGRKKVKDIFIDNKVPLSARDIWPVVEDGSGEIIWLPGLKKSIYEKEDHFDQRYVILYYK